MAAFMKLGDIKGEFAPSRQANGVSDQVAQFTTGGGGDSFNSWRDFRDHNHGKVINGPLYQPEADSFMKLDDIRGEFSPSRQVDRDPGDNFHGNAAGDPLPTEEIISNHGNRTNWDVICDIGTSIKQSSVADALTDYRPYEMNQGDPFSELDQGVFAPVNVLRSDNSFNCDDILLGHGAVHPDMPMDTHPNDILLGFPGSGADALTNYRPEVFSEGVSSPAGYTDFVPAIALRSDNRFVFEPLNAMTSFGDSIDPVLDGANGFKPREVAAVVIGQPPEPKLWLQMLG